LTAKKSLHIIFKGFARCCYTVENTHVCLQHDTIRFDVMPYQADNGNFGTHVVCSLNKKF